MGIYYSYIFPSLLDFVMSSEVLSEQRRIVIPEVRGAVLEIGFGSGLNLPFYPPEVKRLTVIEPNLKLNKRARKRTAKPAIEVETMALDAAGELPISDNSFDTVVSTWTLCSIERVREALQQIHRVLKPGGRFLFVEHGLSPEPNVARWQHRLNGIQKAIAGGCNLNRPIATLIEDSPMSLQNCEQFYLPKTPRILGYSSRGVAVKEE